MEETKDINIKTALNNDTSMVGNIAPNNFHGFRSVWKRQQDGCDYIFGVSVTGYPKKKLQPRNTFLTVDFKILGYLIDDCFEKKTSVFFCVGE